MIQWIKKIKELLSVASRIHVLESELNELDTKLKQSVNEYSKKFEERIAQMTFDYTKNLDDTKSDYLKRYVEVRLNCMQNELTSFPGKIYELSDRFNQRLLEVTRGDNSE